MAMDEAIRQRILRDHEWRESALCRQVYEDFHPDKGRSDQVARARSVCAACPVEPDCERWVMAFEDGMGANMRHGIWARMSGRERWEMDRAAQRVLTFRSASSEAA